MPEFEARLRQLEAAHKELEDSFIVMTHLQTKQSQMLRDQAEYWAKHEERLRQDAERIRQTDERIGNIDERIEKLVSAIGALISKPLH